MAKFILYTYQCNPVHAEIDPSSTCLPEYIKEENNKADANMKKHQDYVQEYFESPDEPNRKTGDTLFFLHRGNYYPAKIVLNQGGIIMLRLQKSKKHEYERNFQIYTQTEEPSSMIIIDNRHEQQRVLIEQNPDTFSHQTIAKIVEQNMASWLTANYRLGIRFPLVYRKDEFWAVVEQYQQSIKKLVLDFPYPNMARPMNKMAKSLKKFGVDLNGKVRLVAQAQPNDFLLIEPNERNEDLDEIISYLFEVGSPVDVYLVSGKKIKCFSKENPIAIDLSNEIATFRGKQQNELFEDHFVEGVAERLNSLKQINYGNISEE